MKAKFISLSAIVLISCTPVLIQFNEDEHLAEVYEDVSGTQDQLYLKANSWMIETFKDAESVVQHSDKEQGVIIGKYLMNGGSVETRISAVIDIRVRDNKARIEIKPQRSWRYVGGTTIFNYSKDDAKREMVGLALSFYDALMKEDVEF